MHTYQDESLCGCDHHREGCSRKQGIARRRFDLVAVMVLPQPENENDETRMCHSKDQQKERDPMQYRVRAGIGAKVRVRIRVRDGIGEDRAAIGEEAPPSAD